jgi:hypothetical protein
MTHEITEEDTMRNTLRTMKRCVEENDNLFYNSLPLPLPLPPPTS